MKKKLLIVIILSALIIGCTKIPDTEKTNSDPVFFNISDSTYIYEIERNQVYLIPLELPGYDEIKILKKPINSELVTIEGNYYLKWPADSNGEFLIEFGNLRNNFSQKYIFNVK